MGIFGGMGARNQLSIIYQGSGFKIWAGWHVINHVMEKPIFEGRSTIAMAREVYGIHDPSNNQFAMFQAMKRRIYPDKCLGLKTGHYNGLF